MLGDLYAPNVEDPDFFPQLKEIILDYPVVLGGDYNKVLDVFLDRFRSGIVRPPRTQDSIRALCKDMGLYDAWRLLNSTYFLISHSLIESIGIYSIGTIAMTDHAPIDLVIMFAVVGGVWCGGFFFITDLLNRLMYGMLLKLTYGES